MIVRDLPAARTGVPSSMSAPVFRGAKDIRVATVTTPNARPDEAIIHVLRCGTDASEWLAGPKIFPITSPHRVTHHVGPMIPGHEFVGEIVAIPEGSAFSIGDIVASGAGVWCGDCARCREGRTNMCEKYYTLVLSLDGGMAEYVSSPIRNLTRVPAGLSINAAGLAQPLAVGIHAARRSGSVDGDNVLTIGGGAIASFVLAGLKHLVDVTVTVVEFPGPKQERALRLGASSVVSPGEDLGSLAQACSTAPGPMS